MDDFAEYAGEDPKAGAAWKGVKVAGVGQEGSHPVVRVSWKDTRAFCRWLTKREQDKRVIPAGAVYRLSAVSR